MGRPGSPRSTEGPKAIDARRDAVFALLRAGWGYLDIGRALEQADDRTWGYPASLSDEALIQRVRVDASRTLVRSRHELGREHLELILHRYEAVVAAWWPAATTERLVTNPVTQQIEAVQPNARAADVVLSALSAQRRLLGLDRPVKEPEPTEEEQTLRARAAFDQLVEATERALHRSAASLGVTSGPKVIEGAVAAPEGPA